MEQTSTKLPETYTQLSAFRSDDIYLPEMNWEQIVVDFFPPTVEDLVQRLSDISAAIYGVMLKQAGILFGHDQINTLSAKVFFDLGKMNTAKIMAKFPDFKADIDGIFKIFISTIFTSNPELNLEVRELNAEHSRILIKGTDRYHKIATALNIVPHLQWPVISPYVQGVIDQMGISCSVEIKLIRLTEQSECIYEMLVTKY